LEVVRTDTEERTTPAESSRRATGPVLAEPGTSPAGFPHPKITTHPVLQKTAFLRLVEHVRKTQIALADCASISTISATVSPNVTKPTNARHTPPACAPTQKVTPISVWPTQTTTTVFAFRTSTFIAALSRRSVASRRHRSATSGIRSTSGRRVGANAT